MMANKGSVGHIFWLSDGHVAGRPGPNLIPWNLNKLQAAGIGAILSVNDGELVHPSDLSALDINYLRAPLAENAPPRKGDVEICLASLPAGYEFVLNNREIGRKTLVHCRQGRDRTGLFLAYYTMKESGVSPEAAIELVRQCRSDILAADGWVDFAIEVLQAS